MHDGDDRAQLHLEPVRAASLVVSLCIFWWACSPGGTSARTTLARAREASSSRATVFMAGLGCVQAAAGQGVCKKRSGRMVVDSWRAGFGPVEAHIRQTMPGAGCLPDPCWADSEYQRICGRGPAHVGLPVAKEGCDVSMSPGTLMRGRLLRCRRQ